MLINDDIAIFQKTYNSIKSQPVTCVSKVEGVNILTLEEITLSLKEIL